MFFVPSSLPLENVLLCCIRLQSASGAILFRREKKEKDFEAACLFVCVLCFLVLCFETFRGWGGGGKFRGARWSPRTRPGAQPLRLAPKSLKFFFLLSLKGPSFWVLLLSLLLSFFSAPSLLLLSFSLSLFLSFSLSLFLSFSPLFVSPCFALALPLLSPILCARGDRGVQDPVPQRQDAAREEPLPKGPAESREQKRQ